MPFAFAVFRQIISGTWEVTLVTLHLRPLTEPGIVAVPVGERPPSGVAAWAVVTGDPAIVYRVLLISAFLLVTTPISAFAVARAAYLRGERMEEPGARDESGKGLPRCGP